MKLMKIGVFDSGVGGENVVAAIKKELPQAEVIFRDDRKNLPYGDKTPEQILEFMTPIMDSFEEDGVDAIVIACNTASTNVLKQLKHMSDVPVVGFVPMIKPASTMTKTGKIVVCATPGTLKSKRYAELKEEYAQDIEVLEPDCSDWASLIESNNLNKDKVDDVIELARSEYADVVVLGCTHYHWIYELLDELSGPDIAVIQPTNAVIAELKRQLRVDLQL